MKKPAFYAAIGFLALLAACSGIGKKVLIMSSGKVQVNGNTVTLSSSGGTHTETTLVPDGDSITVVSPSGSENFGVKEKGVYILNVKKDTLVGSYQRTGTDNSQVVISQENLRQRLDSLFQLMQGVNVSEAARNYHILPFQITRITGNLDAQIIGPFLKMPGSFDPSKEHEIYKFYTNKEVMETIQKLIPMLSR